ncbi:Hypothetical_protein [Hexamita inflata]|uniref:Hypothetical_protein n=1 Tax=Hexamita inflata TaxID=28002 RepID=A0AA86R0G9_9EUKA|nr:Hypothetical protein HINF_LOCUS55580 [Hexamita inflata]
MSAITRMSVIFTITSGYKQIMESQKQQSVRKHSWERTVHILQESEVLSRQYSTTDIWRFDACQYQSIRRIPKVCAYEMTMRIYFKSDVKNICEDKIVCASTPISTYN